MNASDARISHLSHRVLEALLEAGLVEIRDPGDALRALKETLARLTSVEDEADSRVRQMLQKQGKIPGSREWQILYDKYFRAEMEKHR